MKVNSTLLILEKLINMAGAILIVSLFVKNVEINYYANYQYLLTISAVLIPLSNLNLTSLVLRDSAKDENLGKTSLMSSMIVLSISSISIFTFALLSGLFKNELFFLLLEILFLPFILVESFVIGRNKIIDLTKFKLTAYIVTVIVRISLLHYSVLAFVISHGFYSFIRSIYYVFKYKFLFSIRFAKREKIMSLISESLPMVVTTISVGIYVRIDSWVIMRYLGDLEFAKYSTMVKLLEMATLIPLTVAPLYLARISVGSGLIHDYKKHFKYLNIYTLFAYFMLILFGRYVVEFLYSIEYVYSIDSGFIYFSVMLFVISGTYRNNILLARGRVIYLPVFSGIGLICNVTLSLLFVRSFGINGVALGTLISQFLSSWMAGYLFKETRGLAAAQFRI